MPNDDKIDLILKKLDKQGEDISIIKIDQAVQKEQLREHMRRTLASEQRLETVEEALAPITKHVNQVEGVMKMIGTLAAVATVVGSIVEVLLLIFKK